MIWGGSQSLPCQCLGFGVRGSGPKGSGFRWFRVWGLGFSGHGPSGIER